jgi:hypothetical protein
MISIQYFAIVREKKGDLKQHSMPKMYVHVNGINGFQGNVEAQISAVNCLLKLVEYGLELDTNIGTVQIPFLPVNWTNLKIETLVQ